MEAARSGDTLALEGLRGISPLFAIERASKLAGDTAEQRRERRLEHSRPVPDDIRTFVDEQRALIPPERPLGRALGYLHRQWQGKPAVYLEGYWRRANRSHPGHPRDVHRADVNPRAYLHLVTRLIVSGWPIEEMRDLPPDRVLTAHPELCIAASAGASNVLLLPAPPEA